MSLRYLPEHADNALLALELARKEADHLKYTHRTLFALPIDTAWVQQLSSRDDLAEKVNLRRLILGHVAGWNVC